MHTLQRVHWKDSIFTVSRSRDVTQNRFGNSLKMQWTFNNSITIWDALTWVDAINLTSCFRTCITMTGSFSCLPLKSPIQLLDDPHELDRCAMPLKIQIATQSQWGYPSYMTLPVFYSVKGCVCFRTLGNHVVVVTSHRDASFKGAQFVLFS